ncbi:MAG TPA: sulfatase-like hydrolase/transferase [Candidatus Eisenbacteria bacterium]|nr:sulfatase-like hydrolase/transferase [Candidatus Eisenbacteria bacterium]
MNAEGTRRRRPNILLIVSDQERADVLGCYGSPWRNTPNLDRLAGEGVRFEACIAPTPICSPTRASLLTGLYPHGHGILNNTHEPDAIRTELPLDIPTFPRLLNDAGYRLGYVGKWHIGRLPPEAYGFHDVVSMHPDIVAGTTEESLVVGEPALDDPVYARYPRGRLLIAGIDPRPVEETETRRDGDATIGLLERYAKADAPFFLRVDFEGPHHPYMPPEPFASLVDPAAIPPWPNFEDDCSPKPAAQARLLEQRGVARWSWADWQPVVARYLEFVAFMDSEIGRILDAVDRFGLRDDTVVVHTADHGDMTGSHGGQFNKGPLMYEEVCRVPLIVRHPWIGVIGVRGGPVGSPALMPTILDLAGVPQPAGLHVESLVPDLAAAGPVAVAGAAGEPPGRAAFAEYSGEEWGLYTMRMIRTATAKYVYSPHGMDELYDLEADPHELLNRADDPAAASLRRDLREQLRDWMIRTRDPLALWASRVL